MPAVAWCGRFREVSYPRCILGCKGEIADNVWLTPQMHHCHNYGCKVNGESADWLSPVHTGVASPIFLHLLSRVNHICLFLLPH